MNLPKAIEVLKELRDQLYGSRVDALDLAISKLEKKEECEDCKGKYPLCRKCEFKVFDAAIDYTDFPKEGDEYWYIETSGFVNRNGNYSRVNLSDQSFKDFLGIYRTKEEAEQMRDRVREFVRNKQEYDYYEKLPDLSKSSQLPQEIEELAVDYIPDKEKGVAIVLNRHKINELIRGHNAIIKHLRR